MARRNDRNGISWEVDAQGNPVPGTGIRQGGAVTGGDPLLGSKVTRAANEAAASALDPAMAEAELRVKQQQAKTAAQTESREQEKFNRESARPNLTDGQKKVDENFAKEYVDWTAAGGYATVKRQLDQLNDALTVLKDSDTITGPVLGRMPDWIQQAVDPSSLNIKAQVEDVIQRSLRATLGAQFTQAEGDRMIARAFDPRLQEGDNATRLKRIVDEIDGQAKAKESSAKYYEQNGTLAGWSTAQTGLQDSTQSEGGAQQNDAPQGWDESTRYVGQTPAAPSGGFAPYGSTSRRIDNPEWKGVNETVKGMIIAGAQPQQVQSYLQERGISTDAMTGLVDAINYYAKTKKTDFGVNVDDIDQSMTGFEQFRNNAPQTRLGTAAATALDAGGLGIPQMLAGGEGLDYLRSVNPKSAFAGDVAGVIGGTVGLGKLGAGVAGRVAPNLLGGGSKAALARQAATDATYGGIYGGTTEGDPLKGALTATAGSLGGHAIGGVGQKLFQGVTDPAVQYLSRRGIPLTIGQTLGNRGMIGRGMNKLESLPGVGDMMNARRIEGMKAFEREGLNDVVSPLGGRVTTGGEQGLREAQGQVTDAYGRALDGVNIPGDDQFIDEAGLALAKGRQIPTMGDKFQYGMDQRIGPLMGGGELSGREFQAATQNLRKMGKDFSGEGAMGNFAADAVGDMDTALQGLVSRQAPDVLPQYNAANEAFSGLAPFENARIGAINQAAISPAQLARAVTSNTKKFGGRGAAASGKNLTDLMKYGQEVLPSTVPNSGSADRGLMALALPAVLGGGAYGASQLTDNPTAASMLALLAALSTKTGAKAFQATATKRTPALRKAGGLFGSRKARRAIGGAITAPILIE
jgi:hypothetical protein